MPDRASLTFLIGGARSGKSAHAETLATSFPAPWSYIATAQVFDDEMVERIAIHRARRHDGWETIDAPHDLAGVLADVKPARPVLVDCLTLWLSNHMLAGNDLDGEFAKLLSALGAPKGPWFVVANEVGLGIVPDNALARQFRDAAGRLNQKVAAIADRVLFMVAGIPVTVK